MKITFPTAPAGDSSGNGFTPSTYQQAIFDFIENPSAGNAIINAVAGSGKTTTIVQALYKTRGSAVFLAFNKSIALELQSRVPHTCQARTFHSLTYGPVLRVTGAKEVTASKLKDLVRTHWDHKDRQSFLYGAISVKLVGLARSQGIGCLVPDTEDAWAALVEQHGLTLDHERATMPEAIAHARELLTLSNQSGTVDFDDLLYQAVRQGISLPTFGWVFVDEAQDTNAIQRAILRKIMRPNSRLIAVGDPHQAIYGFRGADSNSMRLIAEEFSATSLPLSVSYRCPRAIVTYAQKFVPQIEPSASAPEGTITSLSQWTTDVFTAQDLVVCRNTRPLVALAYQLMRDRVPCHILGKDIGNGLISLVRRMKVKSLDALISRITIWRDREVEKAIAKGEEAQAERVEDQADAVLLLASELGENERTIDALIALIDHLFTNSKSTGVTLATIHKAKGLEADRVFWLNRSACPSKWAKKPWQIEQEQNLMYVAITRAKKELILIEGVR